MVSFEDVLGACAEWSTAEEIQRKTGGTRSEVRAARSRLSQKGELESRFVDGVGFQYRAIAGAESRRRDTHVQDAVLEVLGDSPKTIREIVAETGCARISVYQALGGLVRKGKAVREGTTRYAWRLAR